MELLVFLLFLVGGFLILYFVLMCVMRAWKRKVNRNKAANSGLIEKYSNIYHSYLQNYTAEKDALLGQEVKSILLPEVSENAYAARGKDGMFLVFEDISPNQPIFDWRGNPQKPTKGSLKVLYSFPVSDVLFWTEKGSLQYTSNVSGGGSGITGALIGGAIGGDVGAIIGSRKSIKTETVRHDSRRIVVKMVDATEKEFPIFFYKVFITCMPEKEYEYQKMNGLK